MNVRFKAIRSARGELKPKLPESGFERRIDWIPAYDRRSEDEKKNYGVHGVTMWAVLRGPAGAITFTLFTNWHLKSVREERGGNKFCSPNHCLNQPLPADLGYHSPKPLQDWQDPEEPFSKSCEHLDGAPCWYDGSGLAAEDVFDYFVEGGEEALWGELERRYRATFKKGED